MRPPANPQQIYDYSVRAIADVVRAHAGEPRIDMLLAIGAVCPYGGMPAQQGIWRAAAADVLAEVACVREGLRP